MMCVHPPKNTASFCSASQYSEPVPGTRLDFRYSGETLSLSVRTTQAYKQISITCRCALRGERRKHVRKWVETHLMFGAGQGREATGISWPQ